ncbi:hypothetical protein P12x_005324 [Tundrisphaera lichenicola]|uniref:hypothetical protein n=1 Tax=Tundrisphaera lichenicola TaxID=2029860 RepID=UPI003EBD95A9
MSLERVSFKKGREHKPRLSKPYVPGVRDERYWTEEEDQILRDHYPDKGFAYCAAKLPNRSKTAIYGRVQKLGVKYGDGKLRKIRTHEEYAELDAKISEIWPTLDLPAGSVSGVKEVARRLNEPHWLITQRCRRLGLTRPRKKEPPWSAAEDELMKRVPLHDPDNCSEIFKAHGFSRTATAIMVRAKRINLSRRTHAGFSAGAAAKILGLDGKTVAIYCLKGIIKSSRRGTKRLPQQGGDAHSIERADLRQFVIDNLELIDFRKVDKFAIVELLVSEKVA